MENITRFIDFFRFQEPNVSLVFWGAAILCGISGLVGTFTFLRKRSLLGDVIAHSVLPGIALAFIISQEKNIFVLLIGAVISGWISTYLVDIITAKSKLKSDAAIALVLSVFFGLGMLLITYIQNTAGANQSGLDAFIFGNASAIQKLDIQVFSVIAALISILYALFFRGLKAISFDVEYADSVGMPVSFLKFLLSVTTVLTVAMGVQAVGAILMAALLITPAAAARFWTYRVSKMAILSVLISAISGVVGGAISYTNSGMPTGPWIVVTLTGIAIFSAFWGSELGIVRKWVVRFSNNKKIARENILKTIYHLLDDPGIVNGVDKARVLQKFVGQEAKIRKGLSRMKRNDLIHQKDKKIIFTEEGFEQAKGIVRKHRLWELYISKYMHLAPDHVHDDAEGIEHIITPEVEALLQKELNYPTTDPHNKKIP